MELFDIKSKSQLDHLRPFLLSVGMTDTIIWTSGTDLGSEGHFYWSSTGDDFTSAAPWRSIPNNINNNEHCVELFYDKELNDNDCETHHSYICYRNETTAKVDKTFEKIVEGIVYAMDYQKLNWYMAEKRCKNNKMKLLTVKDDTNIVKSMLRTAYIGMDQSILWLSDLDFKSKDALMFEASNFEIVDEGADGGLDTCAFYRLFNGDFHQDDKNCLDEHYVICVGRESLINSDVKLKPFWLINVLTVIAFLIFRNYFCCFI